MIQILIGTYLQDNQDIETLDISTLQNHHNNVIQKIDNILNNVEKLDLLQSVNTEENSVEQYLNDTKTQLNNLINTLNPVETPSPMRLLVLMRTPSPDETHKY